MTAYDRDTKEDILLGYVLFLCTRTRKGNMQLKLPASGAAGSGNSLFGYE